MSISSFKRFFYLIFLIIFFLIDRLLLPHVNLIPYPSEMEEPIYQNIVYKGFIHSRLKDLEPKINKNLKILILGTSRTLTGLSPQVIQDELSLPDRSVLNFSFPAESYLDIYAILRRHLDEIKKIPLVIVEISALQFYYPYCPYIEEEGSIYEKLSWSFTYHNFHIIPQSLLVSYRKRNIFKGYIIRWLRKFAKITKKNLPRELEKKPRSVMKDFRVYPYGWVVPTGKLGKEEGIDVMNREIFPNPSNKEREWKNFLKIVHLVKKEKLKVLFLEMPVEKIATEKIIKNEPSIYSFFEEKVKPSLKKEGYMLFESEKEIRIESNGFYDCNHLNKKGAIKFSKNFSCFLKKGNFLR